MPDFLAIVVAMLPLLAVLYFANLAQRTREDGEPSPAFAAVSYAAVVVMYVAILFFGVFALLAASVSSAAPTGDAAGAASEALAASSPLWLGLGLVLPSILGIVLLVKPVRRLVARFTHLDPDNPVHAVALSLSMLPLIALGVTLGIGLDTVAAQLAAQREETGSDPFSVVGLWAQAAMFLLTALVGVGWLSRRSGREALARLGLVRPTGSQVLLGVGAGLLLVPAAMAIEAIFNMLGLGVGEDVESLSELLTGPLFATPFGIISVGLAAAIGEEPLFRGAAQPRFGLVLASLIFALVHSQYGISLATLIVFALGMVLGIIRQRTNTTTSILTHAVYNSTLGALAFFAAQQLLSQQP